MSNSPIVCPFCPLHCDDLRVDATGATNTDCVIAGQQFAAALDNSSKPRIGKNTVSFDQATERIEQIFAKTERVKISTASTPLRMSRELATLFRGGRIDLTVDESPTQSAMRTAISRDGNVSATLSDIKKHADLVWSIGNVGNQMPRLAERLGCNTLSDANLTANRLAELFYAMNVGTRPSDDEHSAIADARYLAIIVAPDAFHRSEALVAAELMVKWVIDQNQIRKNDSRRVVVVSVDPAATLRAVVGWHSNSTLRSTSGPVDIRIGKAPDGSHPAALQWGGIDPGQSFAESFVPTSVAGVHHADSIVRGDGTVTLPLLPFAEPNSRTFAFPG